MRIGINGFGRIGRNFLRACHGVQGIDIVGINDLADAATLCHLLKYDSTFGRFEGEARVEDGALVVDGKKIKVTAVKDPKELPWKELSVDYVLESTGKFTEKEKAVGHIAAGARRVLISAPAKGHDVTLVMGVNQKEYDPGRHFVVSNASCTTNCLAPVAKVLLDTFGIERGLMTTIHAYTNDQVILDFPHKDLRRARAAALSMIPTSTGAAKALSEVIPELKGKLDGFSMRVPTPDVSVVDLTVELGRETDTATINAALKAAADGPMKGILGYCDEPLVSVDFLGDARSAIVDAQSTKVIGGRMAKVLAWYDNEWGYSCRLRDLFQYMAGFEK
jgi:glyceraldehyde 3-phosphate dehydrogenase